VHLSSRNFKGDSPLDYERAVENISRMPPGLAQAGYTACYITAMSLSLIGLVMAATGFGMTLIEMALKIYTHM
jgi:hypothetical protein